MKKISHSRTPKTKLPTLTVAIPAHNEEKAIGRLLSSLAKQKNANFRLKSVVVVCDGCEDKTAIVARSYKDNIPELTVKEDRLRLGKIGRLNRLYKAVTTDMIVVLDADVELMSPYVLEEMVDALSSEEVGLAGGLEVPAKPKGVLEGAFVAWWRIWYEVRSKISNGSSVHNHAGCISGVNRSLYKDLEIPAEAVAEDEYLYFAALKAGKKFAFVPNALVCYASPKTIHEYVVQSHRYINTKFNISDHFGSWVERHYAVAGSLKLKAIARVFLEDPFNVLFTLVIQMYVRIALLVKRIPQSHLWPIALSTK